MAADQAVAQLTAIAVAVEERQPEAAVLKLLRETTMLCERLTAEATVPQLKTSLAQVQTAADTWQKVWPRLGSQREFRQAVAREARLWSQRLLAQQA